MVDWRGRVIVQVYRQADPTRPDALAGVSAYSQPFA
jgi:hypothetical protein